MQYNRYEHSYLLIYFKGISTFVELVSIYCNILISENGEKYYSEFPQHASLHSSEISHGIGNLKKSYPQITLKHGETAEV